MSFLSDGFQEFTLVTAGIEHIRVFRGDFILFDGTVPAGFKMHLTLGDKVHYRIGKKWRCKFTIVMHMGAPCVKYGKHFGPIPDQYRQLSGYYQGRVIRPRHLLLKKSRNRKLKEK